MINIGLIITCHNRVEKTVSCLSKIEEYLAAYNRRNPQEQIEIHLFLTDDGCTDGTAERVRQTWHGPIQIIEGTGNLFWAGGMRAAWRAALASGVKFDFYLLFNDDTEPMENVFDELKDCHRYALKHYGKGGVYSGITCSKSDETAQTYGGSIITNRALAKMQRVSPNGEIQPCDVTNANILLIDGKVVEKIGIFYDGYQHGMADYDYSIIAKRNGFPVLLTAKFCGRCDYDHPDESQDREKILAMSMRERKAYFDHPLHSSKDYLRYIRRTAVLRYPLVWLGRVLNLYLPNIYYKIKK